MIKKQLCTSGDNDFYCKSDFFGSFARFFRSTQTWNGKWCDTADTIKKNIARTKRTNDHSVRCSVLRAQCAHLCIQYPVSRHSRQAFDECHIINMATELFYSFFTLSRTYRQFQQYRMSFMAHDEFCCPTFHSMWNGIRDWNNGRSVHSWSLYTIYQLESIAWMILVCTLRPCHTCRHTVFLPKPERFNFISPFLPVNLCASILHTS